MIRGVIFDMDGVITDTERLFLEFWCQVMGERGLPEHREVVIHCIGLNHAATGEYVKAVLGEDFDYPAVLREAGGRSLAWQREHGVPVKPGFYGLLDALDEMEIPYAVATSTVLETARRRLKSIGVWDRLAGIVTGDMVTNGKPAPEIFQRAAAMLGFPPEECMVLEDSPHGILAAHRAGCLPVMVPDLKAPDGETLTLLYGLADSLDQVIPILRRT